MDREVVNSSCRTHTPRRLEGHETLLVRRFLVSVQPRGFGSFFCGLNKSFPSPTLPQNPLSTAFCRHRSLTKIKFSKGIDKLVYIA